MAPTLTHEDDAPNQTRRAILAFVQIIAGTAVLVLAFYLAMSWLNAHHAGRWAVFGATAVYAALVMALIAVWTRSAAVRMCGTTTPAAKRYRQRMLITSGVYVATLLLAVFINGPHVAPSRLAYVVAILPGIAISGMFVSMGLYLREETDEFQRGVQIESSLWATGAVLVICAIWGFLEMFRLVPHVESWVVVPVWALVNGLANILTRRRYRLINRLRELRAERGWSQGDLGEQLGVSRQSVNAIETGKYDPSLPLAFRISRVFGQPIEAIFHDQA